jgi:DNA-binding XRE family transcriptional regulator
MTDQDVKRVRAKLRLTQEGLAKLVGVSRNTVARWEMGMHPVSAPVERLLDALVTIQKGQSRNSRRR